MSTNQRDYFFWLDTLRFLAAFMVLATHARGGVWVNWATLSAESKTVVAAVFFAFTRMGTEWVLIFFCLSGFLIGGKVALQVKTESFDVVRYARRRFFRIYVPLLPALVFSMIVAIYTGKDFSVSQIFFNLLSLQGVFSESLAENYPLWSLSYEVWFYVICGIVAYILTQKNINLFSITILLFSLYVFVVLDAVFLYCWILGALGFVFWRHPFSALRLLSGFMLAVIGIIYTQLTSSTISVELPNWIVFDYGGEVGYLLISSGLLFVLPELSKMEPRQRLVSLIHSLGSNLSKFSYTVYLVHYPVLYMLEHIFSEERYYALTLESVMIYLFRIIVCLTVSYMLYWCFEKRTATIEKGILAIL